jgi:hypothetical protein
VVSALPAAMFSFTGIGTVWFYILNFLVVLAICVAINFGFRAFFEVYSQEHDLCIWKSDNWGREKWAIKMGDHFCVIFWLKRIGISRETQGSLQKAGP